MNVPAVSPELPSLTWRTILAMLRRVPQGTLSRGLGQLADLELPRSLRAPVLGTIARALHIDLSEAEQPLEEYASLNAMFVRRLKEGARPIAGDPDTAVSPVDGVVGQLGQVLAGRAVQAKGRDYSIEALLSDAAQAERYADGSFMTIYLSPRHYHRIHSPVRGVVQRARHVPGALLPVNEPSVAHIPDLFPRNERVIAYVSGPLGTTAVAAIGAYNVGRISAVFDEEWRMPNWASNRRGVRGEDRSYAPAYAVERGAELMAFHLGSTVVLLFEPGVRLLDGITPGDELRIGQGIARREPRPGVSG